MYAYVYQTTDTRFSIIHNLDGYDEISLTAPFKIISRNKEAIVEPRDLGFDTLEGTSITGGLDVKESASIFKNILTGKGTTAQKNVVLANAGTALHMLNPDKGVIECVEIARESLASGKALQSFTKLIDLNK